LRGAAGFSRIKARDGGNVLAISEGDLRNVVQTDAELSEILMRAFILRRMGLVSSGQSEVMLLGSRHSADTLRLQKFLTRNNYPYLSVDIDSDPGVQALLDRFHLAVKDIPVVIGRGDRVFKNPSDHEVADFLQMNPAIDDSRVHDLVVVGGISGQAFIAALAVTLVLRAAGFVSAPIMIATALATSAIGTLLPILRDSGELKSIKFNLGSLLESTNAMLRVPLYVGLFLLVRGAPSLLFYRKDLERGERLPFMLCISTALPLIVAITDIGVATGRMRSENAAALVGAGMVSVLVFPLLALVLRRRSGAVQSGHGRGDDEDAL